METEPTVWQTIIVLAVVSIFLYGLFAMMRDWYSRHKFNKELDRWNKTYQIQHISFKERTTFSKYCFNGYGNKKKDAK